MKDGIKRAFPFVISGFMVVTLLIVRFTVLQTNEEFEWNEFLPTLAVNLFLIVTTSIVWLNAGTERAKSQEKSAYKDNCAMYATQIKKVTDSGRLGELREFCKIKTSEMLDRKITDVLASVGIDRAFYEEKLKGRSKKDLKADGYSRKARCVVDRINNGRIRVKAIRYVELLSDSRPTDDYGVNYDERADKAMRIVFRALRSAVIALALALLAPKPADNITDIGVWALFLMQIWTILYAAFSSEREGYSRIALTKNKVILRRIAFLHEFDEWNNVPKLNNGESGSRD